MFIFEFSKYMAVDILKILCKKSLVTHKYCTITYIAVYIQPEKQSVYCRDQHMPLKAFCRENFPMKNFEYNWEFFFYTNHKNSFTKSDYKRTCNFMKHQRQNNRY